jgi:hypothetical protein
MLVVAVGLSVLLAGTAVVDQDATVSCRIRVPDKYSRDCGFCPSGVPEVYQYFEGYKSSWWRCILTKSKKITADCSWVCGGTGGAIDGCADGARDAAQQVARLQKKIGDHSAIRELRRRLKQDAPHATENGNGDPGPCDRVE